MKFRSFVIFFVLLGLIPDLGITILLLPALPLGWKGLICLPTLAVLVCLPLIGTGVRYTGAVRTTSYLTFLLQIPKTLFALLCPLSLWAALAVALAFSAFFGFLILFVSKHLTVNTAALSFRDLPRAFDGLRIGLISDLHLGSFGRDHLYVRRIIRKVMERQPDILFYAGDLVNFSSSDADGYLEDLAALKAPMGVFSVRGNHDYLHHGPMKGAAQEADRERLLQMERDLGWTVLLDAHRLLTRTGAQIAVAGVENTSANPRFGGGGGDLPRALARIPEGMFTILLTHDPTHWRSEVVPRTDVRLTLSGHTHGLKYKLAGLRPAHWKLHESAGLYEEGAQKLYVTPGLGSSFAFRLGGFPAIDILTLQSESYE